jgi:response regulator RpfG family c-di-GMP phosphodiesterase
MLLERTKSAMKANLVLQTIIDCLCSNLWKRYFARIQCLAAGMNDYVSKPVSPQELVDRLRKWLPKNKDEGESIQNEQNTERRPGKNDSGSFSGGYPATDSDIESIS